MVPSYQIIVQYIPIIIKQNQMMPNPQQSQQNFQNKIQGMISIIKHFKSNSQIVSFSDWFSHLVNENNLQLKSDIYYAGNSSDLWGLLQFQIKSFSTLITQNDMDLFKFKKIIEAGQLFMFYKACSKISNLDVRLKFESLYRKKQQNFKQQLMKQRNNTQNSKSMLYQHQTSMSEKNPGQLQYLFFIFINSNDENMRKINSILRNFLKQVIQFSNNKFIGQKNYKIKQRLILLCLQLLFVLENSEYKTLCLSQFVISDYIIKHLSEKNGAMKIAKYLHDASAQILKKQIKKFCSCAFQK